MTKLRLAIVGAGPAGIYTADTLLKAERSFDVSIDLFDRLPAPYGLVRYGVAPDHPRIKGIITSLRTVLDRGDIRIFGNVDFGRDITLDDLKRHYNAVVFATGATKDADLEIPGIHLTGSHGAAEFVSWYDGHPDVPRTWPLDAASVAVIGNGNVALDVSRILAKHAEDLLPTEVPDNVYEVLAASPVTDVHVFGRRGPAQVKFTPLELRELGEVPGVEMVLYDEDFDYDEASKAAIAGNKQVMVIDRILQSWRARAAAGGQESGAERAGAERAGAERAGAERAGAERAGAERAGTERAGTELGAERDDSDDTRATRRLHLHFYAKPLEIVGDEDGRVSAIRYERTEPDGAGGVRGTGEVREIAVQAVYRAIGYFGSPLPGVPYDASRGVIPNREGEVLHSGDDAAPDAAGREVMPGVFAVGWIKRGPIGLIGSTKSGALETVRHLVAAEGSWWTPAEPDEESVTRMLDERGIAYTDLDGWHRLDAHEIALGEPHGRARVKVVPRDEMVHISRDS